MFKKREEKRERRMWGQNTVALEAIASAGEYIRAAQGQKRVKSKVNKIEFSGNGPVDGSLATEMDNNLSNTDILAIFMRFSIFLLY